MKAPLRNLPTLVVALGVACGSEPAPSDRGVADAGADRADVTTEAGPAEDAPVAVPETSTASSVCGVSTKPTAACVACVDENCCDQARACAENPACLAYRACSDSCYGLPGCEEGCIGTHGAGYAAASMLLTCEHHLCNEPCEHPGYAQCGFVMPDETCAACAMQHCCDTLYEVMQTEDYWALWVCIEQCGEGDGDCVNACYGEHGAGTAAALLRNNCMAIACPTECAFPGDYPCGTAVSSSQACKTCEEERCCDIVQQTSLSEDYWLIVACSIRCDGDVDCWRQCWRTYPEGAAMHFARASCSCSRCTSECGYPDNLRCGDLHSLNSVCDACWKDHCCEEISRSSSGLESSRWAVCAQNCTDEACYAECTAEHPDGWARARVASACQWVACSDECEGSPPCGRDFTRTPACGACVEASCCEASIACGQSYECTRLDLCRVLAGCSLDDTACLDACREAYPDGVATYDPLHACLTGDCAAECEGL